MKEPVLPIFRSFAYIKDAQRLGEIALVFANHGFDQFVTMLGQGEAIGSIIRAFQAASGTGEEVKIALPARVRLVFQDLGPTFIKFGQILSTRTDIIPEEFTSELKKLQDGVTAIPFEDVVNDKGAVLQAGMKSQIQSELGKPVAELFTEFNPEPIGTASIGQAYVARLPNGKEVVVKVQRPNVGQIIRRDVEILDIIARTLEKRYPYFRSLDLSGIIAEFQHAVSREIDYNNERRNISKFR